MRNVLVAFALLPVVVCTADAVECPKEITPCKVIFLSPQQHQWFSGTQQTSQGSVLDAAAKALGADAAGVIAQILMQSRAAQDGSPPAEKPSPSD